MSDMDFIFVIYPHEHVFLVLDISTLHLYVDTLMNRTPMYRVLGLAGHPTHAGPRVFATITGIRWK